jgi:lycopene cyclase CruA
MVIGDTPGLSSPFTFSGFGSHVRNLNRLTSKTENALANDALDGKSLAAINECEPQVAQMAGLAEFLRPAERSSNASAVNETLNAFMSALNRLDDRVRRELFQDRMSFDALKSLLAATARIYPQIFQRLREHLGIRGTFWWIKDIAQAAWREKSRG